MGTSQLKRESLERPQVLQRLLENKRVAVDGIAAALRSRAPRFVVKAPRL